MTTMRQHHKMDNTIIQSTDLHKVTSVDDLVFLMVEILHSEQWSRRCALCDHLISFMPTSAYKEIWRTLSMPHYVTCRMRWGMPLKQLGWQYTICLTSFSRPRILGKTGLTYALTITVNHFNISNWLDAILFAGNKLYPQLLFSYFLSFCFLLPYLLTKQLKHLFIWLFFCLPVSVEQDSYI
jgi:hypothetical protein